MKELIVTLIGKGLSFAYDRRYLTGRFFINHTTGWSWVRNASGLKKSWGSIVKSLGPVAPL